jgi:peptide/nickel transport system substrate-binding protein
MLMASEHPSDVKVLLETIQQNLKDLGIEVRIETLRWANMTDKVDNRNFDSVRLGWAQSLESDPYQIWHSSQAVPRASNHPGFRNPDVDQIIETAKKELRNQARWNKWNEMHQILADEQPYMFLFCKPALSVYHKKFRGVKFYKLRPGYDLTEWWIPED